MDEFRHRYMKACFCIGPQNGDPVCPCRMRAKAEEMRELFRKAWPETAKLWRDLQQKKPRIRVKAGRRVIPKYEDM